MAEWFTRPVLHVADVRRSIDFYVERLGFSESWKFAEDGELFVAQVEREGCAIIVSSQWPDKRGKGLLFISLGPGIAAVRTELESRGAPVEDGRWGYALMVIDDPDGNQLFFNYPGD